MTPLKHDHELHTNWIYEFFNIIKLKMVTEKSRVYKLKVSHIVVNNRLSGVAYLNQMFFIRPSRGGRRMVIGDAKYAETAVISAFRAGRRRAATARETRR